MPITQWDGFIPYTAQDIEAFTSAGADGAAVQRIRLERDRQSLYTADVFLYHRHLRRRMVWQFIALDVRDGELHLNFPMPFQHVDGAWQKLVTHALINALQAVYANPEAAQGMILNADFPVPDDVPRLDGGGENRVAPGFAWNELYIHSAKRYLFAGERVQGMRVLDLGCGTGYGAKILARQAAQVVAADVDGFPLRYGESTYPDAKIQRVHIAPISDRQGLPFEEGSFDAVVSFEVIEHVPAEQMEAFFAEIARVLKPNGMVVLSTPNKHVYIHYPDPYHVSLMTLEDFRRLLGSRFNQVQLFGQVRSQQLPHTAMEFDIVSEPDDGQEIYIAVCREYAGDARAIALPPATVWGTSSPEEALVQGRLRVSVIVHTRNEEHNIAECLERVKDWAGEMIVMDMESTDRTVEIARRYTDKVYHHPLILDFDLARNASAEQFFRFAADVAAGRVKVGQKKLSHILAFSDGETATSPPPSWSHRQQHPAQVEGALRAWKEGRLHVQGVDPQSLDEPGEMRRVKERVVRRAQILLPNCRWELAALRRYFQLGYKPAQVVPNAVRPETFVQATPDAFVRRFGLRDFVLCAARIEPFKNQLMLIWALRDTGIPLVLAGKVSEPEYGALCQRWAGENVHFVGELSPELLASAYAAARVHAMPSWAETPGLTSMEAALAGCAVVVGNQGAEREYFGDFATYCNPADVDSVREAVLQAWEERDPTKREAFREYILKHYTWSETARATAEAYEQVLQERNTILSLPDWSEPQTWQPIVCEYLREHRSGDGALLRLYAGAHNASSAEAAYELLAQYVLSLGYDPEHCADIEITDCLPENFFGRVVLGGSRFDSVLQTKYGMQCERLREKAA